MPTHCSKVTKHITLLPREWTNNAGLGAAQAHYPTPTWMDVSSASTKTFISFFPHLSKTTRSSSSVLSFQLQTHTYPLPAIRSFVAGRCSLPFPSLRASSLASQTALLSLQLHPSSQLFYLEIPNELTIAEFLWCPRCCCFTHFVILSTSLLFWSSEGKSLL